MHLTREEESILDGEQGPGAAKCMEILAALGDIYGADRLIPVESVQVSGVSYRTMGDAGLEFLEDLAGDVKASVPAMMNPAGMDLERWEEMGVPPGFAERQLRIVQAYRDMGLKPTCTCTPYLFAAPEFGSHVAWAESSAVSFVNSAVGARTNREGGPSALAAAVLGKTPNYGLHLDENRVPEVRIEVEGVPEGTWGYGALGVEIGKEIGGRVPVLTGVSPTRDQLKSLGAAMASTGSVALYHVEDVTPEIRDMEYEVEETVYVGEPELEPGEDVDLVALGCPHLSAEELSRAAALVEEVSTPLWLFTSAEMRNQNPEAVEALEAAGARVFTDTCMVVTPLDEMGYGTVLVDSGKAYTYLPGLTGVESRFASTERCLEVAGHE